MLSTLLASLRSRSITFSLPGITINSGSKVPLVRSTPILFFGKSLTWPTEASTIKSLPRYLLIVLAFAGDSTITSDLLILFLYNRNAYYQTRQPAFQKRVASFFSITMTDAGGFRKF